jgi:uncharacterized protein (TIRG00374 family)
MNPLKFIAIALILGLIVFFAIGFVAGIGEIYRVLLEANYYFILIAIAFQCLSLVGMFFRWNIAVKYCKLKISNMRLFLITLSGMTFSNLLPSARMGGEPIRAYFLKKETKQSASVCFSTVIMERIFDAMTFSIVSLFVLIAIFLFWNLPIWVMILLAFALVLATSMLIVVMYVSLNAKVGMRLVSWFFRKFKRILSRWKTALKWQKKMQRDIRLYSESVSKMIKKKNLWAYGFSYSLLIWTFDIFRVYFVFLALGSNVSILVVGGALVIASLAGSMPVSPGGLGFIEAAMIIVFTSAGVPLAVAGMVTIIDRLISYWGLTFVGLVPSYYLGIKKYPAK